MTSVLNTVIRTRSRTIDGLSIRFAETKARQGWGEQSFGNLI